MNLSHTHKFLFIAIPKTYTTTVGSALKKYSAKVKRYKGDQHVSYNFLKENMKPTINFDDYFKFTIVRNPWDRLVSVFHFLNIKKDSSNLVAPVTRRKLYNRYIKSIKVILSSL